MLKIITIDYDNLLREMKIKLNLYKDAFSNSAQQTALNNFDKDSIEETNKFRNKYQTYKTAMDDFCNLIEIYTIKRETMKENKNV